MKAILTGHTRGLGAAIGNELLLRKIPVLGISRKRNEELAARFPGMLTEQEIDLADVSALAVWLTSDPMRQFVEGCKTVLLINNAGTVQPIGPLEEQSASAIAQAVSLNAATPMMLASAVAAASRAAKAEQEVRILHVSSGAGRSAYAGWSVYCATKAALDQHARAVALDTTKNIRICSLAPGVIDTDMQTEIRATPLERFPLRERFDGLKREGQLQDPAICAKRLVDYLLSRQFGQAPVADLREVGPDVSA